MGFEQRELTGSLFKNDDKTEDKHPNAKGSALINGVAFWVAAWTKTDKNGNKYQSLAFKPKEEAKANTEAKKRMEKAVDEEEDLPF